MKLTDNYTTTMQKIIKSSDDYAKKQQIADKSTETFNKRMQKLKSGATTGATGVNSLIAKITGLVSATVIANKALEGMFSAINTSALQKVQETTFQALLKNDQVGSQLYKYVGAYAKTSALGREDLAKGMTSFLTVSRDINQLEQLMKMTERLYAKDPTQGSEGAVFALKEALAGDTISLRNRYGITGLSGESLRAGDTTSKLEQIDRALNQFGATQEVVDKNFNNLTTQINIFKSNLSTSIAEQATPTMMTLSSVVQRLNADMESGKFQPFFNLMINGMEMIGNGIAWVTENAYWLIPVVSGVTIGLVAYSVAQKGVALWTAMAAIATHTATMNWAAAIGVVAGMTAGAIGLASAFKEVDKATPTNANGLKSDLQKGLNNTPMAVEVTNTDPLKVTGKVDIEQENMKYLMEIANSKFIAQYSHNTVVPQTLINAPITKTVDAQEVLDMFANGITEATQTAPQGDYS